MKYTKNYTLMLATLSLSLLASCASGPESYQQKMARYSPKSAGTNQVPEIKTVNFEFKNIKTKNRGPASASETAATPVSVDEAKETNPTNKKLYFLTLYSEYQSLKKYAQSFEAPSVAICPNFHTSLIRHNEVAGSETNIKILKKFSYDTKKLSDQEYVGSHPELMLPLSKDEISPKVVDILKNSHEPMNNISVNELVHKALDIHLAKTYSEIRELCEYGVSDNYYIYENLITHIKSNKFEAEPKNMNILLKTTLFSNIALESSLEKHPTTTSGRSIASITNDDKQSSYANEVMTRLNVSWAGQYFNYIKESH